MSSAKSGAVIASKHTPADPGDFSIQASQQTSTPQNKAELQGPSASSPKTKKISIGASTFAPQTTVRRPMHYNLIESELKIVSHLNGVALASFSFGSFWLSLLSSIWISYAFSGDPTPVTAVILVHWATLPCLVMTLGSYLLGGWSIYQRKTLVTDIKNETSIIP